MDQKTPMHPNMQPSVGPTNLIDVVENQRIQIDQLTAAVQSQGARLGQISSEIESELSMARSDRLELREANVSTSFALSKILSQLDSITNTIKTNADPAGSSAASAPQGVQQLKETPFQTVPSSRLDDPHFPRPMAYDGDIAKCRGFITQCELYFGNQSLRFSSDESRVGFVVSLLSGRALDWAVATLKKSQTFFSNYHEFINELRLVFDHPPVGTDAPSKLLTIRQGNRSVAEYSVEFRLLAAECTWNDEALACTFRRGLNDSIKDQILLEQPDSLTKLIALALFVDDRLRARKIESPTKETNPSPKIRSVPQTPVFNLPPPSRFQTKTDDPEPMQVGRSHISYSVRRQRMRNGLCLYCGSDEHQLSSCELRPKELTR